MRVKLDEGAYEPVRAHYTDAGLDIRSMETKTIAHTKGQVYCEYMYHVGHRRPCPAKDCTAMVPGPMLKVRVNPFVTHERGWEGNGYTEIG